MVKVAGTATAASLMSLLEKSGLLDDRLAEAQALAAKSDDARSLARQLVAQSLVTKWQAGQLLNGFGQFTLGKYRLLDQIGVGRIGREFLATHMQLGKRVAIKLVSRSLTADATRLKQFLADSRQAVSLDHPHLVHCYDVDQDGSRYYVVTEYVDGEDLRRRVERDKPSPSDALAFVRQAAEGLQHACNSGVLHGDVKPSNLLVNQQGSLKVADLGFARLVDGAPKADAAQDSAEESLQTGLEYCAPETLNDVAGDLDCRADIFSLGQTLFFLLTGNPPPAPAATADERAAALVKASGATPQVAALYALLTAPEAADRPTTWKAMLEQVRAIDVKKSDSNGVPVNGTPGNTKAAAPEQLKSKQRKASIAKAIPLPEPEAEVESAGDEVVVDTEPQPFVIDTGNPSRGRGKAKTASSSAAVASDSGVTDDAVPDEPASDKKSKDKGKSDKPAPAPAKTKGKKGKPQKLSPTMVLGLAIGGGLLLVLISVGGLWLLLGGKKAPVEVVKNEGKAGVDPGKIVKAANVDTEAPEVNPEVNPVETNPEPSPPPELTATKPDENPKPPAEPVKPEPAVPTPPTTPDPKPEPTPPVPTPDPAPATPVPAPVPTPAPAAAVVKPFEKLPIAIKLSEVSKTDVQPLGEVTWPLEKGLGILMHGGDGAAKNKVFTLQNAKNETDANNWEVKLGEVIIAKLHREPDKLSFEWTSEAASQAGAANLCNCLLQMKAGTDEHFLQLRTPVEAPAITIDLEKGSKWSVPIDNLPAATVVELIESDQAAFPNPDFKTETTGKIKGHVMWYGGAPESRNLGLLIEKKDIAKKIDVTLTPVFRIDPLAKDTMLAGKLTKKLLPTQLAIANNALAQLSAQGPSIDKIANAEEKERAKNLTAAETKRMQEQLGRLTSAVKLLEEAHDKAVVHLRISFDTGSGKVLLAQTTGAPPPEKLGKKPLEKPAAPK